MIPRPVYHDLWGYPVDWTDPSDGWNQNTRKELINLTHRILTQTAALENYTEIGYLKMEIPTQLYQDILKQRRIQDLKFEECHPHHDAINNCNEIKNVRYLLHLELVMTSIQISILRNTIFCFDVLSITNCKIQTL